MVLMKKRRGVGAALGLVVASACTAWHTTSLEPQRFSAEKSPAQVQLTMNDGSKLAVSHPVLVGDTLVWTDSSDGAPRDSTRRAVPVSSIQQAKVRRVDAGQTFGLLLVGGLVGGIYVLLQRLGSIGS